MTSTGSSPSSTPSSRSRSPCSVLPLVDLVGELEKGISVQQLLEDNKAPIGAFFLSFLVISQVWLGQHRLPRNWIGTNEVLTRLLLLWSLTIVVLPFPTALVAVQISTTPEMRRSRRCSTSAPWQSAPCSWASSP